MSTTSSGQPTSYTASVDKEFAALLRGEVAGIVFGDGGIGVVPRRDAPCVPSARAGVVTGQPQAGAWVSVSKAAAMLGFGVVSFRRLLERNARRADGGCVEASVDGVRARKVGRTWRVQLSDAWTTSSGAPRRTGRVLHDVGGSARHGGNE